MIDTIHISLAFFPLFLEEHIKTGVKIWVARAFSNEAAYLDFWSLKYWEMEEKE